MDGGVDAEGWTKAGAEGWTKAGAEDWTKAGTEDWTKAGGVGLAVIAGMDGWC